MWSSYTKYDIKLWQSLPKPLTFGTINTKLVFSVPQSDKKVKNVKFHKPYGIMEQKSELLNYIFKDSSNLPSKNFTVFIK